MAQNEMEAMRDMPVRVCSTEGLGAGILHMNCVGRRSRKGRAFNDWREWPPFSQEGRAKCNLLTELVFLLRRRAILASSSTHKYSVLAICFDQVPTELVFTVGKANRVRRSAPAPCKGATTTLVSWKTEPKLTSNGSLTDRAPNVL